MSNSRGSGDSWSLGKRPLAYDPESAVRGADVADLQRLLSDLGYELSNDGIYGPQTADQVSRFQQDRQLEVDSVFGPATFGELIRVRTLITQRSKPQYLRE